MSGAENVTSVFGQTDSLPKISQVGTIPKGPKAISSNAAVKDVEFLVSTKNVPKQASNSVFNKAKSILPSKKVFVG